MQINTKAPAVGKETPKPVVPAKDEVKKGNLGGVVVDHNKHDDDDHDDDDHHDDDHDDDNPMDAQTTSTIVGVPIEPGRDIFAPGGVVEGTPGNIPPAQPKPDTDTESFSVQGGGGQGVGVEKERVGTWKENEREVQASTPESSTSSEAEQAAAAKTSSTDEPKPTLGAETENEMDAIKGQDEIVAGPGAEKKDTSTATTQTATTQTATEELDEMD